MFHFICCMFVCNITQEILHQSSQNSVEGWHVGRGKTRDFGAIPDHVILGSQFGLA